MKPHSKIRKTVKWAGVVFSAVCFAAWIGSAWFRLCWLGKQGHGAGFGAGVVNFGWMAPGLPEYVPRGWSFPRQLEAFRWNFLWEDSGDILVFQVPLWAVLAPLLMATAAAWKLDSLARRRARTGLCKNCGYNLSATPTASRCPECGASADEALRRSGQIRRMH